MKYILNSIPLGILLIACTTTSYAQSLTDEEIKKNITEISNPVVLLQSLEPRRFEYNTTGYKNLRLPSGIQYGFLTETVETAFPGMVHTRSYKYMKGKNLYGTRHIKSIDLESLIPILVASVKSQQEEIEKLRREVDELKSKSGSQP